VDGAALLMTMFFGMRASGIHGHERGNNLLDGGAPFYDTYETADGKHVAVGALEPKFYEELIERLGLADTPLPPRMDRAGWASLRARIAEVFAHKTLAQWQTALEGTDACVAPVLDLGEAPTHPHNQARGTFIEIDGVVQPAPAPRFSRTSPDRPRPPSRAGADTDEALANWGFEAAEVAALRQAGAIG